MKTILFSSVLFLFLLNANTGFAQDTLRLKNKSIIVCKVQKISETDIEYWKWENLDGPIYTIDRNKVFEIVFKNGVVEKLIPDEMEVSKEYSILSKRNAVKLDLFSAAFDKITIGFEHSLKVGWNLEGYASFISNQMMPNSFSQNYGNYSNSTIQGIGLKFCNKFFLGSDYYVKGTKYAHPLKGRFVRIDLAFTQFTVKDLYRYTGYPYPYYSYTLDKGNLNVSQYGLSISYGRQLVLGNLFTLQYNLGIGYMVTDEKFLITEANAYPPQNYSRYYPENYYSFGLISNFAQLDEVPLALSGNITFGYILGKLGNKRDKLLKK